MKQPKRKLPKSQPLLPELKAARKDLALTQLDVARHLGITGAAYAKIERGDSPLPLRHVAKLAKLLYFLERDLIRMVFESKQLRGLL